MRKGHTLAVIAFVALCAGAFCAAAAWSGAAAAAEPVAPAEPAEPAVAPQEPAAPEPVAPRPLDQEELDALLERLETSLGGVRNLAADFAEEKHLSIFTDVVQAEGALLFVRPRGVRFELTEPFRSVFIASGDAVAKYEWIDDGWQKLRPATAGAMRVVTDQIASWLEGRLRQQKDLYDISAVAGKTATVTLTPRPEKMLAYITAIELTLSEEGTHFAIITIREPGGDFTRMRFRNVRHNIVVPPELFDTTRAEPAPLSILPPPADDGPGTEAPSGPAAQPRTEAE